MEKLSLKKKLLIIRLYTEGLSYNEIAIKAGVGKGTVSNVITELKSGRFPEFGDLPEQLDLIRELAIDLRRARLTPVQAAVGVSVLFRLQDLGVEPGEIEGLSALYPTLTTEGTDLQSFIRVALSLEEARKRTGLGVDELEMKVKDLEESASQLEPLAKEAAEREEQLTDLDKKSQNLTEKVSGLEKHHKILIDNVRDKEHRGIELSNHVKDLEDRAQSADERLTTTRKDLKTLSGIGMSPDNLSAFAQRLKVIAQRHGKKSDILFNRLMDELEQLDEGLGLDTITEAKKQELHRIEHTLLKAKDESVGIGSTNEKLRQERSSLRAALLEEQRHVVTDIKAINITARSAITKLKLDLSSGINESIIEVNNLRDYALQLGSKLGQLNEMIESEKWLKSLQALLKGDESVDPNQVRMIGIIVQRGILSWLDRYYEANGSPHWLRQSISNMIGELERWKP